MDNNIDKNTNTVNICANCRFCTHEDKYREYVCHNEKSENYGKALDVKKIQRWACKNMTKHTYKELSLKDALHIETQSDDFVGAFYHHKLPDEENNYAFVTLAFKTNAALEEWKDANLRLFTEYIKMAQEDGDFTDTSES